MRQISQVIVPDHLKLHLTFSDGTEGELDLSREPRTGVFTAWEDPDFFAKVTIGERGRSLVWPGEIDLCADSLWLEMTGKPSESIYPSLQTVSPHA